MKGSATGGFSERAQRGSQRSVIQREKTLARAGGSSGAERLRAHCRDLDHIFEFLRSGSGGGGGLNDWERTQVKGKKIRGKGTRGRFRGNQSIRWLGGPRSIREERLLSEEAQKNLILHNKKGRKAGTHGRGTGRKATGSTPKESPRSRRVKIFSSLLKTGLLARIIGGS